MGELDDFQGDFLGGMSESGAMELLKAMQAGNITGRDTTGQTLTMEPLKAESLETTLAILEYRQKDIKLLNRMPKLTAYNTVEEFLQLQSYGGGLDTGFYGEGELSDVEDSEYVRRSVTVKYLQVTGEVTLQAQMVKSFVDAMRQEVENKAMWINRAANTSMTSGNPDHIPLQWAGIYKQLADIGGATGQLYLTREAYYTSDTVVDLRGASLKQTDVEKAAVVVDGHFGNVTDLFAPPTVISALSQDYFDRQRILQNASAGYIGNVGTVVKSISTSFGDVALCGDKMMKTKPSKLLTDAGAAKAPQAPTVGTAPALVVDALSKYQTGETGAVRYAVSAINRFGESNLTLLGSGSIAITVGDAIDLTFTATSSSNATTAFRIYRTKVGIGSTGQFYPLFTVSASDLAAGYDGAAALSIRDRGRILPDMETAFVTEMVEEVIAFKQLAPMSKLDLAVTTLSKRFITFLFGTPRISAPRKVLKFINVSKTLTA